MTPSPIKVLIVDDHPVVRSGLRAIERIDAGITVVGEAASAALVARYIETLQPDVVLLDIRLPDGDGVEVCRRAKARNPQLRVVCLSSFSDQSLVLSAMTAGADAYLLKHNDAERIVEVIRIVIRGEQYLDPAMTAANEVAGEQPLLQQLSPGEYRVLAQVAKGLTDKEVASALGLSTKTVRNYLDRAFAKLGVHTRTQAALLFSTRGQNP